eukprot:s463_g21.t1
MADHIHYGDLSGALGSAGEDRDAFTGSNIHVPSDADIVAGHADDMARARLQHEEAVRAFEQKRSQREMAVPTGDAQVKAKLREFGEPACIFGEGPYERRDRLRTIMAGRTAPTLDAKRQESTGDEDRSVEELLEARVKIAEWSLPRANQRLVKERRQRFDEDPVEQEESCRAQLRDTGRDYALASESITGKGYLHWRGYYGCSSTIDWQLQSLLYWK